MEQGTLFILCVIFIAFAFDFINGFHDAANSIATIVTTQVLTPKQAVLWAAFFNLIAFLFFRLLVAKMIGEGIIDTSLINPQLVFSSLVAAITWGLLTWYFGLPSSSSHALIGGLSGAAFVRGGVHALQWDGLTKIGLGIFLSPLIGLVTSFCLTHCMTYFMRYHSLERQNKLFKGLQLISSAFLSLTHGSNDAQKTMGIIAILLFSASWIEGPFYVPFWVVISCQTVISLGTLFGGWRIVHTMGTKITALNTMRGCAAETGSALAIFAATEYGVPVSTTQTITGGIAGTGLVNGIKGTHWPMLRIIFVSWIITIPATATLAGFIMYLIG